MRRDSKTFRLISISIIAIFLSEMPIMANPDMLRQSHLAPKSVWEEDSQGSHTALRDVEETLTILEKRLGKETVYSQSQGLNYLRPALYTIRAQNPKRVLIVGAGISYLPAALAVMGIEVVFIDLAEIQVRRVKESFEPLRDYILFPPHVIMANIDSIDKIGDAKLTADTFDIILLLSLIGDRFRGNITQAVINSYRLVKSGGIMFMPNQPSPLPRRADSVTMEQVLLKFCPTCVRYSEVHAIETYYDWGDRQIGFNSTNYAYLIIKPAELRGEPPLNSAL